ncbi:cadherin-like beta sandwich domain-containing protein [Paenibacillus terrigena]|uniref:cadherin-like beta sandwich domain-containing protein n=1 Tax=Paenibacillus terrigena TaxID=369333 RepID=UPI0028D51AB8|nr:cadherin-like beta sandwich domain-containing protein [Paenibacillus terrigena]
MKFKTRKFLAILNAAVLGITPLTGLLCNVQQVYAVDVSVPHVLISEIYGGGNQASYNGDNTINNQPLYANDYVKLYNPGNQDVHLGTWSLQYAADGNLSWKVIPLTSKSTDPVIPAHGFFLVQLGGFSNSKLKPGQNPATPVWTLPTPDAVDPALTDMDNKVGKIALVSDKTALAVANPASMTSVVDFVGYGTSKGNYMGNGPVPALSVKKTAVRQSLDPSSLALGTDTKKHAPYNPVNVSSGSDTYGNIPPVYGSGWDTGDNALDFVLGDGYATPQNSSSTRYPAAIYTETDANNDVIAMSTPTAVDPNLNAVYLTLPYNTGIKSGVFQQSDYAITSLPTGMNATVSGDPSNNRIVIALTGTAQAPVTSNVNLGVVIKTSAVTTTGETMDSPEATIVLQAAGTVSAVVEGNPILRMSSSDTVDAAANTFTLALSQGGKTIKSGALDPSQDFIITGLPDGMTAQAVGMPATNTVAFTINGTAISPVLNPVNLSVVLNASAAPGAMIDSDPITGIKLDRYRTPVLSQSSRKDELVNRIKDANAFNTNPDYKNFKYTQMAMSPFYFYRGTEHLFYQDLGTSIPLPKKWNDFTNIKTWLAGDAHTQNVGYFDDNQGNIVFDLNDFDASYIAPFYLDLLRMTTSLYLTRDDSGLTNELSDDAFRSYAKSFLDQYMQALQSVNGNNLVLNPATKLTMDNMNSGFTKDVMKKLSTSTQLDTLNKWTIISKGSRIFNVAGKPDKYDVATDADKQELKDHWQNYLNTLSPSFKDQMLAINPHYFDMKDIAARIYQGLGSIGVKRFNVLIEGPSSGNDDDMILDVKEESPPDLLQNTEFTQPAPYDSAFVGHEGLRARTANEMMLLNPESHLGNLETPAHSYLVRKISPFKGDYTSAKSKDFTKGSEFADYISYIAKVFAYDHARADARSNTGSTSFTQSVMDQIYHDPAVWSKFESTLLNLSEDYYHQVKEDYSMLKDDLNSGALIDIASLNSLAFDKGTLERAFSPSTLDYTLTVDKNVDSVDLTAVVTDAGAKVVVNGASYTSATARTISLNGLNFIVITVTARDGVSSNTYTVTVGRETDIPVSSIAVAGVGGIDTISTKNGTLQMQAAVLPSNAANSSVTWAVYEADGVTTTTKATIDSNGLLTAHMDGVVKVVAIAMDGSGVRGEQNITISGQSSQSGNADLSGLTLSPGTLAFDPDVTDYSVSVDHTVTSINVTPTAADAAATIQVNGTPTVSGAAYEMNLDVGVNDISIEVKTQSGAHKTYTIKVYRASEPSSNADLQSLLISSGSLIPVFNPGVNDYTVNVDHNVSSFTLTPTVAEAEAGATLQVTGATNVTGATYGLELNVGANLITIEVKAANDTKKIYTLTVNRAEAPVELSNNANLSSLEVLFNGSSLGLSPAFASNTTSYSLSVKHSVDSLSIHAVPANSKAVVRINGVDQANGASIIGALPVGDSLTKVEVTAEDGTQKIYWIKVSRSGASTSSGGNNSSEGEAAIPSAPNTDPSASIKAEIIHVDGKVVAQSKVDDRTIGDALKNSSNGQLKLVVDPTVNADKTTVFIANNALQKIAAETSIKSVNIETKSGSYTLPAKQLNLQDLALKLGVSKDQVNVEVTISSNDVAAKKANASGQKTLGAVEFTVKTVSADGKSVEISSFAQYVSRTMHAEGNLNGRHVAVVRVETNSSGNSVYQPVPFTVTGTEVTIYSRTNGTYLLLDNHVTFGDVNQHWAKDDIERMASRMIVQGVSKDEFQPDKAVTRAEFAALIARTLGLQAADSGADRFTDVRSGAWFEAQVYAAAEAGIINGYEDQSFHPNQNISRQEMAVMIYRAMNFAGYDNRIIGEKVAFADEKLFNNWAKESISVLSDKKIVEGVTANKFDPTATTTRAQSAVILSRMLATLTFTK